MIPVTEELEAERAADHSRAMEYILERVTVDQFSGCWEWQKATSPTGYGVMRWGPKVWRAHRFAYHFLVGYLHKAEPVHHRCGNRLCVNPEHLQAVTHEQNGAEMLARQYLLDEIEGLRIELDDTTRKLEEAAELAEMLAAELDHHRSTP